MAEWWSFFFYQWGKYIYVVASPLQADLLKNPVHRVWGQTNEFVQ